MEEERGPRCGIENCRSTKYHLGEDGYRYCRNGHRAETQVATQDEDFVTAVNRRTRKRTEARSSATTVFEGREAKELYLQSFQLILWKQVYWLVHKRGYPPELENIIRDLWALRLKMLEGVFEDAAEADRLWSSQQSETETGNEKENENPASRMLKPVKLGMGLKLIETLGLCYLGILLLRLPIMSSDIRDWVMDEGFTYLRAVQTLPTAMKQRLPPSLRRAFHVQTGIAELEKLQGTTMNLATAFRSEFGMETPALNDILLAFRMQTTLCLPLEVLPAIKRLEPLLKITYTFPFPPPKRTLLCEHPELQLITALIIITKLFYPFDSIVRYPKDASEPAALAINWSTWNELYVAHQKQLPPKAQKMNTESAELKVEEKDVFNMSKGDIDNYLDWFGRTYIDKDEEAQGPEADFRNALYRMFPIDDTQKPPSLATETRNGDEDSAEIQRLKAVHASLVPLKVVRKSDAEDSDEEKILRPGSQYRHYRSVDELPDIAKPFFEAAAGLVNLQVSELVIAVFQMEQRLQGWVKRTKKELEEEATAAYQGLLSTNDNC